MANADFDTDTRELQDALTRVYETCITHQVELEKICNQYRDSFLKHVDTFEANGSSVNERCHSENSLDFANGRDKTERGHFSIITSSELQNIQSLLQKASIVASGSNRKTNMTTTSLQNQTKKYSKTSLQTTNSGKIRQDSKHFSVQREKVGENKSFRSQSLQRSFPEIVTKIQQTSKMQPIPTSQRIPATTAVQSRYVLTSKVTYPTEYSSPNRPRQPSVKPKIGLSKSDCGLPIESVPTNQDERRLRHCLQKHKASIQSVQSFRTITPHNVFIEKLATQENNSSMKLELQVAKEYSSLSLLVKESLLKGRHGTVDSEALFANIRKRFEFIESTYSNMQTLLNGSADTVLPDGKSLLVTTQAVPHWRWYFPSDINANNPPLCSTYSSSEELLHYNTCLHEIQSLQLQIDVVNTIREKLLPRIRNQETSETNLLLLFKQLYSLTCEGGMKFPVLLKDVV